VVSRNFIDFNIWERKSSHNEADLGNDDAKIGIKSTFVYTKRWRKNASIRLYNKYMGVESEGTSEVVLYRQGRAYSPATSAGWSV